jgi:intein/homing endonuclease
MPNFYEFPCGCRFLILDDKLDAGGLPRCKLDIEHAPLNCNRTWEMLSKGLTKGVFQLESKLGRQWTKRLRPENIDHLTALGSLLRPGCLRAIDQRYGCSTTELYCRRKNGEAPVEYLHPVLEPILKSTYAVLAFQEQAMEIAKVVAGFNLQEADELRKCISGDSLFISSSRGYITLRELLKYGYKKDSFLTMSADGEQSWDSISNIWFSKKTNGLKLQTQTGLTIKCTEDHKLLTNHGWKEAKDITTNDYLVTSRTNDFQGLDVVTDDLAIVIAGVICEGYCGRSCTFVNHNVEMMNTFLTAAYKVLPSQYVNTNNPLVTVLTKPAADVLYRYISPVKSKYKILPDVLMRCSKEQCRKYLSFILACEGGITKHNGQFEFCSKSPRLARQVRNLLRRFGIVAALKKKCVKQYGKFYRLYINDVTQQNILLQELTCLWPSNKVQDLTYVINKKNTFCFSSDLLPKNICAKFIEDGGKPKEGQVNFLKRRVSFAKLKRIAHNDYWIKFSNGQQYYDKVNLIKKVSNMRVYEFSMTNTNMPYAVVNSIVTANCIGKKLPEEMAKVKIKFLEGAAKVQVVSKEVSDELFAWIQESQRYSFNRCVAGSTIIRRMFKGKHQCNLTVAEMYNIRNNILYAKDTGHLSLYKKWKLRGNYGKGLSMYPDGRIKPNTIVDIKQAGKQIIYRITTEGGAHIDVTINHKFPTPNGIKTVADLIQSTDNQLYVSGSYEESDFKTKGYPTKIEKIISIQKLEEVYTYDVTMEAPNHNFVVDTGIVTCNSHAACYALNGYRSAYCKAHFPVQFFCSYLRYAKEKQDPRQEIRELVNEAKLMDIDVTPPDIRSQKAFFYTDGKLITFGLSNVKGVGVSNVKKLTGCIAEVENILNKKFGDFTWYNILVQLAPRTGTSTIEKLVTAGAFRHLNLGRRQMLAELEAVDALSPGELSWIQYREQPFTDILTALKSATPLRKNGGAAHSVNRSAILHGLVQLLEHPPNTLEDSPNWIASQEEVLLGIPITCTKVDGCDTTMVNCTCRDFINGNIPVGNVYLGVELNNVVEKKIRNGRSAGQNMAHLTISDGTCSLDNVACFAESWKEYKHLLSEGNTVILQGERDRKKGGFIVKKVWQAHLLIDKDNADELE